MACISNGSRENVNGPQKNNVLRHSYIYENILLRVKHKKIPFLTTYNIFQQHYEMHFYPSQQLKFVINLSLK